MAFSDLGCYVAITAEEVQVSSATSIYVSDPLDDNDNDDIVNNIYTII
jgi:hypothetical protein